MKKRGSRKIIRGSKSKRVKSARSSGKTKAKEAVKKKKHFLERISSGIPKFDELVGGGFLKDTVNLIIGGAGSGKTIFATQFLVDGAKKGEPGVYVTFEEKKERFYEEMLELGWDLAELEKKKKFFFIEYTPEQVKKMLEEGGGEIEVVMEDLKAKRIVIDSISSFTLLFESELEKREASLALFELLRKWNVTSILTLEQEPFLSGGFTQHISSPLEFEVDGIMLLYFVRPNGERIREFEILKMRGTGHSKKIFGFEIKKGGIKITGKGKFTHIK